MKILIDTNIVIYHANGDNLLSQYLQGNHILLSFISEMELLSYPKITDEEELQIREYLNATTVIGFSDQIKNRAIMLRREYRVKLMDAIIAATAMEYDYTFFTADEDFKKIGDFDFVLYQQ